MTSGSPRRDQRYWTRELDHGEPSEPGMHHIPVTPSSRKALADHVADAHEGIRGVMESAGTHKLIHRGEDSAVSGALNYTHLPRDKRVVLQDFQVDPQHRRQGIGSSMLSEMAQRYNHHEMVVQGSTDEARPFYEKHGAEFHPSAPHRGIWDAEAMDRLRKQADLDDDWLPSKRLFGPTFGLDHRLFEGDRLKPAVRADILGMFAGFCQRHGYVGWREWARVYFAGSEASMWTSETLEGNGDFDILVGIDAEAFRTALPQEADLDDVEIAHQVTGELQAELNNPAYHPAIAPGQRAADSYDLTWYVNPASYDIRDIRPYAAYDVTADTWAVRPPQLPDWDITRFPEGPGLVREISGVLEMARGILAMPEPYRTQNGDALWHYVHDTRSQAFGPQGEGWWDARNAVEKALDQGGLLQPLWECMDRARHDPHALDAPTGWSNTPRPWTDS